MAELEEVLCCIYCSSIRKMVIDLKTDDKSWLL